MFFKPFCFFRKIKFARFTYSAIGSEAYNCEKEFDDEKVLIETQEKLVEKIITAKITNSPLNTNNFVALYQSCAQLRLITHFMKNKDSRFSTCKSIDEAITMFNDLEKKKENFGRKIPPVQDSSSHKPVKNVDTISSKVTEITFERIRDPQFKIIQLEIPRSLEGIDLNPLGSFKILQKAGEGSIKNLFSLITNYLPNKNIFQLSLCSRSINKLCNADQIWKYIAKNFKIVIPKNLKDSVKSYVIKYKRSHLKENEGVIHTRKSARKFKINKNRLLRMYENNRTTDFFEKDRKQYKISIYGVNNKKKCELKPYTNIDARQNPIVSILAKTEQISAEPREWLTFKSKSVWKWWSVLDSTLLVKVTCLSDRPLVSYHDSFKSFKEYD